MNVAVAPAAGYPRWRQRLSPWSVGAAAMISLLLVPIAVVALSMLGRSSPTWQHICDTVLTTYLWNTALLVAGVGACTLVIGVSCAWLVTFYRFPGRAVLSWALVLPFAIPTYIAAYCYADLQDLVGVDMMNLPGAILVVSLVLYPYVYLITCSTLQGQSGRILESSQSLGRGAAYSFWRLGFPIARPAIVGGMTLVTMEVLNEYGAVHYYGVDTFTTGIFKVWYGMDDTQGAMRLAATLMMLVLALLLLERLQRGRKQFTTCGSDYRPCMPGQLRGSVSWLAAGWCTLPVLLGFLFPVGQLLIWLKQSGASSFGAGFAKIAGQSFVLASCAALTTVIVAVILAYTVRLHRSRLITALSKASALGYSMPGAVIAIGVMVTVVAADRGVLRHVAGFFGAKPGLILTSSIVVLLFAYVLRYLTVAVNPIEAGFERLCGSMDEASRALGHSPLKTLLQVNLPLAKSTLIAAALLVFVDVLKELPLTLILRPTNFETLATKTFELAGEEMIAQSAIGALLIVATGIVPILILDRLLCSKRPT